MSAEKAARGDAPVLYLGDFNEDSPSNPAPSLLTQGEASWAGRVYTAPLAFQQVHPLVLNHIN